MYETLSRLRYTYFPDHLVGELLAKRWMDNAIPPSSRWRRSCSCLLISGFLFRLQSHDLSRQFAETGLVALGLSIVMLSGGIDLSVGSVFGLAVLTCLDLHECQWDLGLSA